LPLVSSPPDSNKL